MRFTTILAALLGATLLTATAPAAAQERAPSLEEMLATLFECSPAFAVHQARTRRAEAGRLRAAGAFDVVASAALEGKRALLADAAGLATDASYQDLELRLGLGALTRENIGLSLTGSAPLVSSIDLTLSPIQPLVGASVTLPLTKLGRAAAFAGQERASGLHAEAAAAAQADAESELASRVAEGYWRWIGSYAQWKLTRSLEELANDQLRDVDQLIAQHARAAVDRLALVAAVQNAAASRQQAEQLVFEAQQQLWQTLGLPSPATPLLPAGELPAVPAPVSDGAQLAARAHQLSLSRPLWRSLSGEVEAQAARAEAARIAKRPDLALVTQASATRVVSAAWDPASTTTPQMRLGYYGSLALQFALPLQNRAARGALAEAEAAHRELSLGAEQQRNAIAARIDALGAALATLTRTYRERSDAAEQLKQAYEAQRTRFRLGTATTMDIVVAEQQYMSASLATVADATGYAVALTRLRHEAGALQDAVKARDAVATARALTNPTF